MVGIFHSLCRAHTHTPESSFLKARDLDVDAAFDMIVDTMDWRERERMAAILDEPLDAELLEFLDERYPGYYCGFDREGYPIYYEHTPGVKWLELLDKIGFDESIRLHYKLMEFQSRVRQFSDEPTTTWCCPRE